MCDLVVYATCYVIRTTQCFFLFFFLMIRRPPRSTLDRSSAASDVYKRQALKGFFKKILVFAGKTDYNVSKVEMIEMSGDNTILNFTNRELNSDIPDAVFTLH